MTEENAGSATAAARTMSAAAAGIPGTTHRARRPRRQRCADFEPPIFLRDLNHIRRFEPVQGLNHQNSIRRNGEDMTMTSFPGLNPLKAITLSVALSMTAGVAMAGDNNVSADQIVNALKPKPPTRGLSAGSQVDPAVGGEAYNQGLSERRADTIKRYLTEKYGIAGTDLVTVGYGKDKPKDPNAPMDPINRRVQVVNMDTKTASK
jgi:hypothetical protein